MYNDIYQTNKHAFRDGFVVGVIATITTAIIVTKFGDKKRRETTDRFVDEYTSPVPTQS